MEWPAWPAVDLVSIIESIQNRCDGPFAFSSQESNLDVSGEKRQGAVSLMIAPKEGPRVGVEWFDAVEELPAGYPADLPFVSYAELLVCVPVVHHGRRMRFVQWIGQMRNLMDDVVDQCITEGWTRAAGTGMPVLLERSGVGRTIYIQAVSPKQHVVLVERE